MVDVLEPFSGVRATFNLVPSLIVQLQAFSEGRARDRHLAIGLAPAESLGPEDRAFLVANGFHAAYHRMIAPFPRYQELHGTRELGGDVAGRGRPGPAGVAQARLDGPRLAGARSAVSERSSTRAAGSRKKTRRCSPAVERELLQSTLEHLSASPGSGPGGAVHVAVLPSDPSAAVRHRRAPGSPSACRAATASVPAARSTRASRWPAPCAFIRRCSGGAPLGMWPSEGSVSNLVVPIAAAEGLRWMATDEDVLARTLGEPLPRDHEGLPLRAEVLYRPYEVQSGGARARVMFRDHGLSDRIGFVYQSWEPQHAADDFLWRIRESARRFSERSPGETPLIAVILDGENAWEHYVGGGPSVSARALRPARGGAGTSDRHDGDRGGGPGAIAGPAVSRDPGFTRTSTSGRATGTTSGPGRSSARPGTVFDERAPFVPAPARDRAYEELLIAEGLRLVLVVRRRPFVRPGQGLRRAVPAPLAERLRAAGAGPAGRVARHQHQHGAARPRPVA